MSIPFQDLFSGGKPHRRVLKGRVITDAQGHLVFQPLEGQAHIISGEDSLDTIEPQFDAFLNCGCSVKPNQPRFHCCEPGCTQVVCEQHVKYCHVCAKGLCAQCQNILTSAPGQRIDLCPVHYHEASRRQFWSRLAKAAVSPFIKFDDRNSHQ